MLLTEREARTIVEAIHNGWEQGSVDAMLSRCTDDLIFLSNTGPNGGMEAMIGKAEYRDYFEAMRKIIDSHITIEHFRLDDTIARMRVLCRMRHLAADVGMLMTYRVILTFRGLKICRMEYFVDAPKLTVFWAMVAARLG